MCQRLYTSLRIKAIAVIAIVALLVGAMACSKDDPESNRGTIPGAPDTPENPGHTEISDSLSSGYDFSPELLDATTRVHGPRLSLVYSEPGVMASTNADGSVTLRSIVTGAWVTFNDGEGSSTVCGVRTGASLEINGVAVTLDTCALEAVTDRGRWWSLVLHGDTTYTALVLTDL